MIRQQLQKLDLPDSPGVYMFKDAKKRPIYIGRATSLKDRVKSYFSADLIETRGPRIVDMAAKAGSLSWQKTDNVLEAIILESVLIKRYQPYYNVDERDDKSSQYVVITKEAWPRVFLARARDFDLARRGGEGAKTIGALKNSGLPYKVLRYFGPYTESGLIKEALKILRRLFPFRDKKAYDPRHEGFYKAIGMSPDRPDGKDGKAARRRYLRTIRHLILFFEGKKKLLRNKIKKEMDQAAREMRFEDAMQLKKLLFAIDHVNDIALLKSESLPKNGTSARSFRLEAYDIAHLSGTNVVGAMAVSINGKLVPSEYRKFKLSREANDDIAGLTEMLFRRLNHSEWAYPDMIIVDGNRIQANAAENVLKARRIDIPVVGVTKDDRHRAASIIGDPNIIKGQEKNIVAANAEAHRFAIAYHRQRRRIVR
jgi:excinuclease ABC subunit C